MNIYQHIQHWAKLVRESYGDYDSQILDERRHRKRRNPNGNNYLKQRPDKSNKHNSKANIKRSIESLGENANDFVKTFLDGRSRCISLRFKGRKYQFWLDRVSRKGGVDHIIHDHLFEGGTAYAGGFTLADLNRDLPSILKNGQVIQVAGDRINIELWDGEGSNHKLLWRIVASFNQEHGRKWQITSIYTGKGEEETQRLQSQYNAKMPGTISAQPTNK